MNCIDLLRSCSCSREPPIQFPQFASVLYGVPIAFIHKDFLDLSHGKPPYLAEIVTWNSMNVGNLSRLCVSDARSCNYLAAAIRFPCPQVDWRANNYIQANFLPDFSHKPFVKILM